MKDFITYIQYIASKEVTEDLVFALTAPALMLVFIVSCLVQLHNI